MSDFHTLLVLEDILLKASGSSIEATFRNLERRLFIGLGRTFFRRSEDAIRAALRVVRRSQIPSALAMDFDRVLLAIEERFDGWGEEMRPMVRAVVSEAYRAGKVQIWRKARGDTSRRLESDSPHLRRSVIKQVDPELSLIDEDAIRALTNKQVFWIGRHYTENLSRRVSAIARSLMLERGLGRRVAGPLLEEALRAEFGLSSTGLERDGISIPEGWKGSSAQYFEGIAANTVTTGRVQGAMKGLVGVGAKRYEVVNALDERTCERCSFMDGKVLDVRSASARMDEEIGASSPEDVKRIHPWATTATALRSAEAGRGLVEAGHGFPPFHFRCRCTVDISEDFEFVDDIEEDDLPQPIPFGQPPPGPPPPGPPPPEPPKVSPRADELAAVLASGSPEAIRQELRVIGKRYGSDHVFRGKRFNNDYKTLPGEEMGNVAAYHGWNGEIVVDEAVHKGAVEFARINSIVVKEGTDLNELAISGGSTIPDLASNMRILIHEEMHGRSPIAPAVYQGAGVAVEELTTEVVARKAMRETFGLDVKVFKRLGRPRFEDSPGSYNEYIHRAWDGLQRNMELVGVEIDADEAYRRIEMASELLKKDESLFFLKSDDFVNEFVNKIDLSDISEPEDREIVRRRMVKEFGVFSK